MPKKPLNHYSPVFANSPWADNNGYTSYFRNEHLGAIDKSPKGKKQWGRERGLYAQPVERALDRDLENGAALVYRKFFEADEFSDEDRMVWAQFLLSQLIRTPTFMRYESFVRDKFSVTNDLMHDRVGCKDCQDLNFVIGREWYLLVAHKKDYFVRTDNPVFQTGFVERPETCLFYPIAPRLCFVAGSMPADWNAYTYNPGAIRGVRLPRGWAFELNFNLAKSAGESLILSPEHDGHLADKMFKSVLGIYPQPPFSLHHIQGEILDEAFESIRTIMSAADGIQYPDWHPNEMEPFPNKN